MRIEPAEAVTLAAVIERDLAAISGLEQHAGRLVQGELGRADMESLGFTLHNIYNALENSFSQISLSFENHIRDQSRWHRELLEKMFLELSPFRPAVLPERSRTTLGELLGFRHLFRHAYEFTLDRDKTVRLWREWEAKGPAVKQALLEFANRLRLLLEETR